MTYSWWPLLTFLIGALCAWIFARWGWKKGKKYEEVFDRVVEETSDESTKIRTLTEDHESDLLRLRREHEAALAKLKADHDTSLVSLRKDHDAALAAQRNEAARLQGLVAAGGNSKAELDALRAQLQNAKDDRGRLELEWKRKIEAAESLSLANTGKLRELEATHAKAVADWDRKVKEAESKATVAEAKTNEAQGLLGAAKADSSKISAEWTQRVGKLEADLAASREASVKLEADWKLRHASRETELTNANAAKIAQLEASHASALAALQAQFKAAESKRVEVQGLLGSVKTDSDRVSADWAARVARLESELASSREVSARADADWKARYAKLEADFAANRDAAAKVEASYRDLDSRFRALEATHASSANKIQGLTAQLSEANAGPDNLMLIEGIGPKINLALNAAGITRWKQVRDADEATLRAALEKGGISFAPSVSTWSGQAKYLCDGDMVGFKAYTEYLVSGQDPSKDAGQSVEDYIAQARPRVAASLSAGQDGLRTSDGKDNLLIIEGIGPKFNQALLDAGLTSFQRLADSNEETLRSAISKAGLSFAPSLPTWSKQAELLAKGDRAAFDEYVALLVAGRDASA